MATFQLRGKTKAGEIHKKDKGLKKETVEKV